MMGGGPPGGFNQGQMMGGGQMMGNPAQQILSQVRSPPPGGLGIRSPQAGVGPRGMIHSPRIPSPRGHPGQQPGMDDMSGNGMMLGQPGQQGNPQQQGQMGGQMGMNMQGGPGGPGGKPQGGNDGSDNTMTPQDQLSKFVETL